MGKKKFFKWIAPICLCTTALGLSLFTPSIFASADNPNYTTSEITIRATHHKRVTIFNAKLKEVVLKMLDKKSSDSLYSDDFLNHDNFKLDASNPIYQLDFSNTGVTDIRELVQFEFPSHIQGINLAGNGITNEHLSNLTAVLNLNLDTNNTISLSQDTTYTTLTNFSEQIKKVNLNDNSIDLQTISSTYLDNTKLLFGIQNFNTIHSSTFVLPDEVNAYYYIRDNIDENYLTFTFTNALSTEQNANIKVLDQVTSLTSPDLNDTYTIKIMSVPDSSTAYFKGYKFEREFTQFTLELDEDFTVERKSLFNLNISPEGQILEGSPVKVSGFGDNSSLKVSYTNGSTQHITTDNFENKVAFTIEKDGKVRDNIERTYTVVDTVYPVIKLIGSDHVYSSKNKPYIDPGVIAYDPAIEDADDGDDMTPHLIVENNVNPTVLGTYSIKYTVSDFAGNTTTITRIVEIQEQVLDHINLSVSTEKLVDGEDIILIVKPDLGVDITKYTELTYYWYINDVLVYTSKGDTASGKSTNTIIGDHSSTQTVYVKLVATRLIDNAKIELYSDKLTLDVEKPINNDQTIIIATAIVIILILGGFVTYSIIKYRKSKNKTHKKKSSSKKDSSKKDKPKKTTTKAKKKQAEPDENKEDEIKVIKDYDGDSVGITSFEETITKDTKQNKPQDDNDERDPFNL